MKRLSLVVVVTCLLSFEELKASSEPDHLVPANRSYDRTYFSFLRKKLETKSFDCGQILVRPPFTGEYCISCYSERSRDTTVQYRLTMAVARTSLWQTADGGTNPAKAERVKISRSNSIIPAELGGVLREALTAMVDETRPLGADEKPSKIIIEGPLTDIATIGRDGKIRLGEMGNLPPTTPKLSLLTKLIANLKAICESQGEKRSRLITEAIEHARALQSKIKDRRS
jgi:hypothetical protein